MLHTSRGARWLAVLLCIGTVRADTAPARRDLDAGREQLHALLWMQKSEEYRLLVTQVYAQARERLPSFLAAGTAVVEQKTATGVAPDALPTAVILDVDETILDNSAYQARLTLMHVNHDPGSWDRWVLEANAPVVPGALEFVKAAAAAGHRIYYVTNRTCPLTPEPAGADPCPQRTATMKNLAKWGFPFASEADHFLLRNARPEWRTPDKSARRAEVARGHRVVALFGDDLRDFTERANFESRRAELTPLFGQRWFILPNPVYGSWEQQVNAAAHADAVCEGTERTSTRCANKVLAGKYRALDPARP